MITIVIDLIIYLVVFITLIAALIAAASQLLYKKGLKVKLDSFRHVIGAFKDRNMLLGFSGYLVSLVIYLYALANAPLSFVYPTFASTFIFVTLISHFVLKEKITTVRALGVLLIFVGIAIVATTL